MSRVRIPRLQGDERGVALPLALVGLVAVTLLVSTALVTSTIELAISSAHQAATESLYLAEGGLEAFVAARGTVLHEIAGTGSIDFSPPGGAPVQITVVHLGNRQTADSTSLRLFSVRSTPAQGGRSVAAQVTQMLVPPRPLALDITSALMAGGHLDVAGTDARVNGRPLDAACGAGGAAVRVSGEAEVAASAEGISTTFLGVDSEGNEVQGEFAIDRTGPGGGDLHREFLGGMMLEQLIGNVPASHRWGRAFSPPVGPARRFSGRVGEGVAVVDGEGGSVRVDGGRGVLIILNGDLDMTGDARFDGVIIVGGRFRLDGRARIHGSLIALSGDIGDGSDLPRRSSIAGSARVQYDRCAVDDGVREFNDIARESPVPVVLPTFAWQEVVR